MCKLQIHTAHSAIFCLKVTCLIVVWLHFGFRCPSSFYAWPISEQIPLLPAPSGCTLSKILRNSAASYPSLTGSWCRVLVQRLGQSHLPLPTPVPAAADFSDSSGKKVRKKWWQNNPRPHAIRIYEAWLAKPMEPELTCRRDWSKSIRRTLQRLSSQHQGGTRTSRVPQITVHE